MAAKQSGVPQVLSELVALIRKSDGFAEVLRAFGNGQSGTVDGAWGSSCALVAAAFAEACPPCLLVIAPRASDVEPLVDDLAGFLGEVPLVFPAWEALPSEFSVTDAIFGQRLRAIESLESDDPPRVLVTSIGALLQPVPSQSARQAATRTISVGDELDLETLLEWLTDQGFDLVPSIELPGEFSPHGGILDVSPASATDPVRLELFGDEVESIRRFDVETQRRIAELQEVRLTLVAPVTMSRDETRSRDEKGGVQTTDQPGENFVDLLPAGSRIAFCGLPEVIDEGRSYLDRLENARGLYSVDSVMSRCTDRPTLDIAAIAADGFEMTCHLRVESLERLAGPKHEILEEFAELLGQHERAIIACHNPGELERLQEMLAEFEGDLKDRVALTVGRVARGFRLVSEQLVVIGDHELFGRTEVRRAARRSRPEGRAIDSFLDLQPGDLVVHLSHGIGRYLGMDLLEKDQQKEEHLVIEFQDNVRIFVPVSLIHLVQKYVGASKASPRLSKLGGSGWQRKKLQAAEAVKDLAAEMLRIQAGRDSKAGLSSPPDSHWQAEFEAAFPYTETSDQVLAIQAIKEDMERPRPMDRLICGDVGFGKTEVAIRGVFKAVDAGRQVAVLVPTTVLADQHYRTFCGRMAEFPITIDVLSRFRTKGEQQKILDKMAEGSVDIVIGTHRLIQPDVKFKDLGLLVIDEEQRFGVAAKDMLKAMRMEVDVLTLSATPIPRTLHMALLGIRDISNLETPPQDRLAVETRICRFDGDLIRQAIVRELNRNGQVYFVHNRVYNIRSIAERIQQIVPEASIGIAHGQMSGDELEAAMLDFVAGRVDVLVCTTIIESGLDIPNANTIFIHQADQYGLADLHQLRGRVGRHTHRAYCYLLLAEGRTVTPTAAKRLKAIEEFNELGSGFKIAMRDLEIRGAGNLLGTQQSGHISAVGYELYCQLLENAVRQLRNEPIREHFHVGVDLPISAFFPSSYVPAGRTKMDAYRKLSAIRSLEMLDEFEAELRDRFGPIPDDARRLLDIRRLQLNAQAWQIDRVFLEDGYAVLG